MAVTRGRLAGGTAWRQWPDHMHCLSETVASTDVAHTTTVTVESCFLWGGWSLQGGTG